MTNGSNSWGGSYSLIAYLETCIKQHSNVSRFSRHADIIMKFDRKDGPQIVLICLNEYTLGEAAVQRVLREFPAVNYISVGGKWNGYTKQAKSLCLSNKIGLFNLSELTGAIWKNDFWKYHERDDEGNPMYPYRTATSS